MFGLRWDKLNLTRIRTGRPKLTSVYSSTKSNAFCHLYAAKEGFSSGYFFHILLCFPMVTTKRNYSFFNSSTKPFGGQYLIETIVFYGFCAVWDFSLRGICVQYGSNVYKDEASFNLEWVGPMKWWYYRSHILWCCEWRSLGQHLLDWHRKIDQIHKYVRCSNKISNLVRTSGAMVGFVIVEYCIGNRWDVWVRY